MAWFARGVQSAIFHYVSCAPCTGYMDRKHRRRDAKAAKKAREKLVSEQPDLYHHPEPTGTNPYWQEEIAMGPGPPPRRARRTNTGSTKAVTIGDTHSAIVSHGSSTDINQVDGTRLSDDTLEDDENWNRKRYQREDEDLWGLGDAMIPLQSAITGSSVGVAGLSRPATARSGSYYSVRAPPVNDLHPPVVSLPSPHPSDNHWMLQPPPKATVMAGKERARTRSRSGSGASSRVELSLQRQVSARHIQYKIEHGETPGPYPMSRGNSYNTVISAHRQDRPRTPQARPPSAASSRRKKRRDTAMTRTDIIDSSGDSSDTIVKGTESPKPPPATNIKVLHIHSSRQELSTILSSGSGENSVPADHENDRPRHIKFSSTQSSDSAPYLLNRRPAISSSDVSSLTTLQDLVSPRALLESNFVSAPLVEAKIRLPPSDRDEEKVLSTKQDWNGSGFAVSRGWSTEKTKEQVRVPFDSLGAPERDPTLRWSVDF